MCSANLSRRGQHDRRSAPSCGGGGGVALRNNALKELGEAETQGWESAADDLREYWMKRGRIAITSYLARMAEAGWVMERDVPVSNKAEEWWHGWNACRAAMLGKGE